MRSTLTAVTRLVPPPSSPRGLDRSWDTVERELGRTLPTDYKAFIDLYGTGQISSAEGWAAIWNFRDASLFEMPLREALCGAAGVIAWYQTNAVSSGRQLPYPLYPDRGGVLPFATVIDTEYLNWLTKGAADRWEVVYWGFSGPEFTLLNGDTFGRCLLKMLREEYAGLGTPSSLKPPYRFEPRDA